MNGLLECFRPSRFLRLAHAQLTEQWRGWLAFMLVASLLYILVATIPAVGAAQGIWTTETQAIAFFWGLMLSGPVFAARCLSALSRNESALLWLMRPASVLEKWLFIGCMALVLYPLACTLLTLLVNAIFGSLSYHKSLAWWAALDADAAVAQPMAMPVMGDFKAFNPLANDPAQSGVPAIHERIQYYLVYVGLSGFALLGQAFFYRAAGLKTITAGFALLLLTVLLANGIEMDLPSLTALSKVQLAFPSWTTLALAATTICFWVGVPLLLWLAFWQALRSRDLRG